MISRIAHPTDFSPQSSAAFLHALRLALEFRCALDLLHVRSPRARENWTGFPQVRETLSRWGLIDFDSSLSEDARGSDASDLGITVEKVEIARQDPVAGISESILSHRPELILMATHQHAGLASWLSGSVSESIARETHIPTLFFGPNARPFVNENTGEITLSRVVVPLARDPSPRRALHRLNNLINCSIVEMSSIH